MTMIKFARKSSPCIVALLALAVTVPAFAQGGGRRAGGNNGGGNNADTGGGRNRNNNNNADTVDTTGGGRFRNNNNAPGGVPAANFGAPGANFGGPGGNNFGNPGGNNFGGGNFTRGGGRTRSAFSQLPAEDDYQILTSTSIFARNRIALDTNPGDTPTVAAQTTRVGPPPVFVGVMEDNGGYVAFLELTSNNFSSTVVPVRPGDPVQWDNSTVKSVSMDKIQVVTNGQTVDISLGHNFRNEPAQPVATYVPPVSLDVGNRGNFATGGGGGGGNFGNRGNQGFGFGGNNGGGNNFGGGFGGGGRGGRGGGGGGFGGGGGGFGGGGGGFGGNNFGAAVNTPTTPVITNDPPLPAGTADDIEARLRARRATQVGGGG